MFFLLTIGGLFFCWKLTADAIWMIQDWLGDHESLQHRLPDLLHYLTAPVHKRFPRLYKISDAVVVTQLILVATLYSSHMQTYLNLLCILYVMRVISFSLTILPS